MTVEERVDRLEKSLGKQDEMVRELRDAVTVTAHLEAAQGHLLKEHSKWLVERKEAMKDLDERISRLVSGFGEFMRSGLRPAS
jgi:uncharacterized coiled-coil protein SlyX